MWDGIALFTNRIINKKKYNTMAAIDKIYVNRFEDYLLFKEWCKEQPKIKDKYGNECSILEYLYQWESFKDDKGYPILNAPYYIDAYIIRNCPFDFIQNELKLNYGYKSQEWIDEAYNAVMNRNDENKDFYTWLKPDDFKIVDGVVTMPNEPISDYELIKEGKLYATPYTQKKYAVGKHVKCIKHPPIKYNTPFGYKFWFVEINLPDELGYVWYHRNHNSWDFTDEFVICNGSSSVCLNYKTIRAIKRAIRKWKLPIGTTIECTDRLVNDTYIFQVTK